MFETTVEDKRRPSKVGFACTQLRPPYLKGFIQVALGQQKVDVCLRELVIGCPWLQPIPGLARVREVAVLEEVSKISLCNVGPLGYSAVCHDLVETELHRVEGIKDSLPPIRRAKDPSQIWKSAMKLLPVDIEVCDAQASLGGVRGYLNRTTKAVLGFIGMSGPDQDAAQAGPSICRRGVGTDQSLENTLTCNQVLRRAFRQSLDCPLENSIWV